MCWEILKNEIIFEQKWGKIKFLAKIGVKKWCNYPGVVGQKRGGGYPPKRVVPGICSGLVLPCPPLLVG